MENEVTIIYAEAVYNDIIAVVYCTRTDPERKVKILLNSPVAYLRSMVGRSILPTDVAKQQVFWMDEEPHLEDAAKIVAALDAPLLQKLQAWCDEHGVTMKALFHGISCFLCNPKNDWYLQCALDLLPFILKKAINSEKERGAYER